MRAEKGYSTRPTIRKHGLVKKMGNQASANVYLSTGRCQGNHKNKECRQNELMTNMFFLPGFSGGKSQDAKEISRITNVLLKWREPQSQKKLHQHSLAVAGAESKPKRFVAPKKDQGSITASANTQKTAQAFSSRIRRLLAERVDTIDRPTNPTASRPAAIVPRTTK